VRPYPLAELPRLLRAQVELGRALWHHLGALLDSAAVTTDGDSAELRTALGGPLSVKAADPYLIPAERAPALLRGGSLVELEVMSHSRARAVLAVDEALCRRLGLRSPDELAVLLRKLLRGAPVRLSAAADNAVEQLLSEAAARTAVVVDAQVRAGRDLGWARVILRADLRLLQPPPPSERAVAERWKRRRRIDHAAVTLRIEAGYGFLPARAVVELSPGDVVLLDHFGPKPVTGGLVALRLGAGVFPAYLDGGGVTIMSPFHLRAEAMADENPDFNSTRTRKGNEPPPPPAAASSAAAPLPGTGEGPDSPPGDQLLGELPVQLTCEIGRLTLPAREVLELRPGAVLPVGRPLAGPVDLTAGGRVIARGELVDVEGEIGVRITELAD
jgi:type III secretion system YscQ/HrcQ family protein